MSGVYIYGMQKPEKCDDCPLQTADMICEHSSCPMIRVPDHGRLVDADALVDRYGDWYTEEGTEEGFIGALKYLLYDAPTIIPEDKKDPEP